MCAILLPSGGYINNALLDLDSLYSSFVLSSCLLECVSQYTNDMEMGVFAIPSQLMRYVATHSTILEEFNF